jgi:CheY-like chemotaxis protein
VILFETAIPALKFVKENFGRVGLVLSDVSMPEMSGMEFLLEVRQDRNLKGLPVICMAISFEIIHLPISFSDVW